VREGRQGDRSASEKTVVGAHRSPKSWGTDVDVDVRMYSTPLGYGLTFSAAGAVSKSRGDVP